MSFIKTTLPLDGLHIPMGDKITGFVHLSEGDIFEMYIRFEKAGLLLVTSYGFMWNCTDNVLLKDIEPSRYTIKGSYNRSLFITMDKYRITLSPIHFEVHNLERGYGYGLGYY